MARPPSHTAPGQPLPPRHPGRAGRAAVPLILLGTIVVIVGLSAGASAVAPEVETRLIVVAAVALGLGTGLAAWALQLNMGGWRASLGMASAGRRLGVRARARRWGPAVTVFGAGALTVGATFTGDRFVTDGGAPYAVGFGLGVAALAGLIWWTVPRYLVAWEVTEAGGPASGHEDARSNAVGSVAVFLALIGLAAAVGAAVVKPRAAHPPPPARSDATPLVVAALTPSERATLQRLRDRLADSPRPAERHFAGALTGLLAGTAGALGGLLVAARTVPTAAAQALAPLVGALGRAGLGLAGGRGRPTFKPTFKTTVTVDGPKFSLGGVRLTLKPHIEVRINRQSNDGRQDDDGTPDGDGQPNGGGTPTGTTPTIPRSP